MKPSPLPALRVGAPPHERPEHFWSLAPLRVRQKMIRDALRRFDAGLLLELVDELDYLDSRLNRKSPDDQPMSTARLYRRGMLVWLQYAQERHFDLLLGDAVTGTLWVRHVESLTRDDSGRQVRAVSVATVRTYLAGARRLYAAIRKFGVNVDPFREARPQKDSRPAWERREAYAPDQVDQLVRFAVEAGEDRLAFLALLSSDAGLRVSEVVKFRYGDFDSRRGVAQIWNAKGEQSREVAVSPRLMEAFSRLPVAARRELVYGHSQQWYRRQLRGLCDRAGVPYKAVHPLRATHATGLDQAGVRPLAISRQLGHKNVSTTMGYLKDNSLDEVKRALTTGTAGRSTPP